MVVTSRRETRYVGQMKIWHGMKLTEIAKEMNKAGVLGAGRFARATEIAEEIFGKKYTCFLSLAGPMVPGGLRRIIRDLILDGYLSAVISTGANITHDVIEALGCRHRIGTAAARDTSLRERGVGRIYDINIGMSAFKRLEKWVYKTLDRMPVEKRENIAGYELLWEMGRNLKDDTSILRTAYQKKVPIICPGIQDSMLGMNLWTYSTLRSLTINQLRDLTKLTEVAFEADKAGAIILGGGVPKHHLMIANMLRGGLDAAIQITMDRPEPGGLSGAPLEEAISWGKIRNEKKIVTVIGDATIMFPLIVATALDAIKD